MHVDLKDVLNERDKKSLSRSLLLLIDPLRQLQEPFEVHSFEGAYE